MKNIEKQTYVPVFPARNTRTEIDNLPCDGLAECEFREDMSLEKAKKIAWADNKPSEMYLLATVDFLQNENEALKSIYIERIYIENVEIRNSGYSMGDRQLGMMPNVTTTMQRTLLLGRIPTVGSAHQMEKTIRHLLSNLKFNEDGQNNSTLFMKGDTLGAWTLFCITSEKIVLGVRRLADTLHKLAIRG